MPVRRQTFRYLPSLRTSLPFGRYQIILLGDRGTCVYVCACEQLTQGRYVAVERQGRDGRKFNALTITQATPAQ